MPVLSVLAYKVRAPLSGVIGALMFIIPVAPGPPGALSGTGLDHHEATAVRPPASTSVAASASLSSVACTAHGACTAGGNYEAAGRQIEPMIATQFHGRWSRGTPLALPTGAATQPYAQVNGIACRSAGTCVAVGDYEYGRSRNLQAFIATESGGRWARAFTPRLPANAAAPVSAELQAVACTRDGSCTAVGSYQDSSGNAQTMVLAKPSSGPWRQATEIASPPNAAANPDAYMTGIACSAPGTCVAVGNYSVSPTQFEAMGAVESRGAWHRSTEIAAPPGAIASTFTAITSISCLAAGPCLGAGQYAVSATQSRAMVVTESKGRFGRALAITAVPPGASAHPSSYLLGVSCRPSGVCFAVGGGRDRAGHSVAMYLVRSGGRWRVAFLAAPNGATAGQRQLSALGAVSCTGTAHCSAVGYYHDQRGANHAEAASTR
ncbi:MAG TPA: hypothetical protein VFJ07_15755 [Streptosporangiaceae bacterium]|nr:hypothetical protein [Streptosporangiaceae bacterium]